MYSDQGKSSPIFLGEPKENKKENETLSKQQQKKKKKQVIKYTSSIISIHHISVKQPSYFCQIMLRMKLLATFGEMYYMYVIIRMWD